MNFITEFNKTDFSHLYKYADWVQKSESNLKKKELLFIANTRAINFKNFF